jgi:hypothetical protein
MRRLKNQAIRDKAEMRERVDEINTPQLSCTIRKWGKDSERTTTQVYALGRVEVNWTHDRGTNVSVG